jgi:PAS domain S-box-containing protein
MSEAAVLAENAIGEGPIQRSAPSKPLWLGGSLAVAWLGSLALVLSISGVLTNQTGWRTFALAGGSGAVMILVLARSMASRQRSWLRQSEALETERSDRIKSLEMRLSESQEKELLARKAKADELKELTLRCTALQSELDKRKLVERNLSQQRLNLESSKTVLELHVQERSQEVQKLKRRYELILDSAGEGICGFDVGGKVAFVNPAAARLTGWSREEMLGKTEQQILFGNGSEQPDEHPNGASAEQMICRKDGSRFPAECVRTPITECERPAGAVLIFKGIAERKRAEEALSQRAAELARSNAELEQFAFVASHDLQEPLRKILAFGDRLKTKCNGAMGPEGLDYLERMQNAAARMRTLIDDLLAFSRVIRDAEPFASVDLAQITREVLGDLEVRISSSGGRVETGDLPRIEADATQMRQLLLNLIGNALKFQPPGAQPVVKVSARTFASVSGERHCELTVQDNGIGFEEQYAEKIFAVFQRLHGRGEYEGTGIGLAVCRRIADRHHGSIIGKSKPGEGATFIVTLPVSQSPRTPAP